MDARQKKRKKYPRRFTEQQFHKHTHVIFTMPSVCPGVNFDNIAREWRCKYSPDNDKKALQEAQKLFETYVEKLKALDGFVSLQRVVCGGCFDFKIITKLNAAGFGGWEESSFTVEKEFLAALEKIEGISNVETQTFTLESF